MYKLFEVYYNDSEEIDLILGVSMEDIASSNPMADRIEVIKEGIELSGLIRSNIIKKSNGG